MSYSPSSAAQAIANQLATNLTNAGYSAMQSGTVPKTGPECMFDALLASFGFQASYDQAGTSQTNATATWQNVYSAWTVNVPLAKTYLLHVDAGFWLNTAVDTVYFQTLLDGGQSGVTQVPHAQSFWVNTLVCHTRISWRQPIAFATAGNHTIQLQWKTTGTGTAESDSADCCLFTLTG